MARLNHRDQIALINCIGKLYSHHDLEGFTSHVLATVSKVITADHSSYNELNLRRKRLVVLTNPLGLDLDMSKEAQTHIFRDHPLVHHLQQNGEVPALRISDFLTRRLYHETGLYREVYRHGGAEYQMGCTLPSPSQQIQVGISLNRQTRDFSSEEQLCLNLLRPHLFQAYHNAEVTTRLREQALFREHALGALHQGTIVIDAGCRIKFCSTNARQWLAAYFPPAKRKANGRLPEAITDWIRLQNLPPVKTGNLPPPRQPLTAERKGWRLIVRLLTDSFPGQQVLVLEERPTALSPAPAAWMFATRAGAPPSRSMVRVAWSPASAWPRRATVT